MKTSYRVVAGATALAAATHIVPAATWLPWPTKTLAPRLKGIGRADHVGLTFDDGPDPVSTPLFLDALADLGWKATFFVLGSMARSAPEVLRDAVAQGHEIGVHGDSHRSHLLMGPRRVRRDLERAVDSVVDITGVRPTWFRPPYGELSAGSVIAARALGLRTVLWSEWGRDWVEGATPESIARTVLGRFHSGSTILLHDSDCTSAPGAWRATLGALPLLAEELPRYGEAGPLGDHF